MDLSYESDTMRMRLIGWVVLVVVMVSGGRVWGLAEVERVPTGCKVVGRAGTFKGLVEKMKPVLTFPVFADWNPQQMMLWTSVDKKGVRSFTVATAVSVKRKGKAGECVVVEAEEGVVDERNDVLPRMMVEVSTGKAAKDLEGGWRWARVAGTDAKRGTVYEIGFFTEFPVCGAQEHRVMVMQTEKGAWKFLCSYTGNIHDGQAYVIEVKAKVEWVGTAAMPLVRVVEKGESPEKGARDVPWYRERVYVWAGTKMNVVKEVSYVVVRKGETLSGICGRLAEGFGDASEGERAERISRTFRMEILKANPGLKADHLEVGQRLVVPEAAYRDCGC